MGNHITLRYHGLARSVSQWAGFLGIKYYTLLARVRNGWSPELALESPVHCTGGGRRTHGATGSKEYRAWLAMRERCTCPRYERYDRYGGRGISVCPQWQESFQEFLRDVGNAPSPYHSLGRLDNDGNYEPSNVCWQTAKEQAANRASPSKRHPTSSLLLPNGPEPHSCDNGGQIGVHKDR